MIYKIASFPADPAWYADTRHHYSAPYGTGASSFHLENCVQGRVAVSAEAAGLLPGLAGSSLPGKRPTVRWGGAPWSWASACFPLLGLLRQSIFYLFSSRYQSLNIQDSRTIKRCTHGEFCLPLPPVHQLPSCRPLLGPLLGILPGR